MKLSRFKKSNLLYRPKTWHSEASLPRSRASCRCPPKPVPDVFIEQAHKDLRKRACTFSVFIAFVEMERFELLTPCLQGRCSPN